MRRRTDIIQVLASSLFALPACGPSGFDDTAAPCASGAGDPVDLVPWLRIRASGTRPAEDHDWPREADAGASTLRDDLASNGWQPPAEEAAVLALDLQPWLGRSLSLDAIEARWEGEEPDLSVALLPGCGLGAAVELAWGDPSQPLNLGGRCAGCVELRVLGGEDTVLAALTLTSRDEDLEIPSLDLGTIEPAGELHTGSGVIEGFYGQPWSWRERQAAMVTLRRGGMDLYVYAPKDDPYHRDRWREPYPQVELDAFTVLAATARALEVELVVGVSPFIDLDPSDEDDYALLRDKLQGFAELGVGGVALLADDIELEVDVVVDGELGGLHATFADRLLADLRAEHPGMGLWFVPTVYSDERLADWEGAPAYLEALQALDPSIRVMWTGPGTFAEAMQAADLEDVRSLIGRDPTIWDNYWANDAWDLLQGRVHLDSYDGRGSDLAGAVQGVGVNPMIQGSLSRLNIGALAAWLDVPDPETDLRGRVSASTQETQLGYGLGRSQSQDALLLALLMEAFDGNGLTMPAHPRLVAAVEDLASDPADGGGELLELLAWLTTAGSRLHHSGLDSELVDELVLPTDKLRHEGLAGLWAMAALHERLAGGEGAAALEEARAELDLSAESRFVFSAGVLEDLVEAVAAVPVQDLGLAPPTALPHARPGCTVGQPMAWQPILGTPLVEAFGLPGARTVDGVIHWTPPHAGSWQVVVTARNAAGAWAWLETDLRCWPG